MKLTAKVKLQPTIEQHQLLFDTLETANQACNYISDIAWQTQTFNKFGLQKLVYQDVKTQFGLTAQVVVRCIGKVADAYKADKKTKRIFTPQGAIAYDDRILRWYVDRQEVSIWSVDGRLRVEFACGERQLELLQAQRGESDLCLIDGEFYLFATCDIETLDPQDVQEFLGIDLGIKNIAADSEGETYAGNHVNNLRKRHNRLRRKLQKKGTKAAKRLLKKRHRKERRMASHVNHVISKKVVKKAKDSGLGIALENLKGIRERVTVRKSQRQTLSSWSFYDLQAKIIYKAKLAGIPVVLVDPRNTSRTCSVCGYVDKANRKTQDSFLCMSCGFASNADINASKNISILGRGTVSRPDFSDAPAQA